MSQKLSNLLYLVRNIGLEVDGWTMDERKDKTYHELKHSYKDIVIIPTAALSNTFDFFIFGSAIKKLKLADGSICEVEQYEEKHICDLEDDIKEIYNVDVWSFVKRWYKYEPHMTNMMFLKIWLKKDESESNG